MPTRRLPASICLLYAVLTLSACPGPEESGTGTDAPPRTADSPPPAAAPVETETSVPGTVQSDDGLAGRPGARLIRLELDGLRLGGSYDEMYARIHADGTPLVSGIWADSKGGTGVMQVSPIGGARLPADDYFFENGQCIGYFKRFELSFDDYLMLVRRLAVLYDPAAETPPDWAAQDPLIRGLPVLEGASQRLFWDDPGREEVLIIQRLHPAGQTFCALYRPGPCAELGLEYGDLAAAFEE